MKLCTKPYSFNSKHPQDSSLLVRVDTVFRDVEEFVDVFSVQLWVRLCHLPPDRLPVAIFLHVQLEVVCCTRGAECGELALWRLRILLEVFLGSLDLPRLVVLSRSVVEENVAANCAHGLCFR